MHEEPAPPPRRVPCPGCGRPAIWDKAANPWRPFCSKRCRLLDLGDWFEERHRIPERRLPESEDR